MKGVKGCWEGEGRRGSWVGFSWEMAVRDMGETGFEKVVALAQIIWAIHQRSVL